MKIKKVIPTPRGQYLFVCFAEYEGEILIVFRDSYDLSTHAKAFDEESVFVSLGKDLRFDIEYQD